VTSGFGWAVFAAMGVLTLGSCWAASASHTGATSAGAEAISVPTNPVSADAGLVKVQERTQWIPLRSGAEVNFLNASEAVGGGQKTLIANFATKTPAVLKQPAKLIESSDELFGRFVILTAEQNGYGQVVINVKKDAVKPGQPAFEDFVYARGANTVWLRQAGKEKWKVAQNPAYEAKPLQVLTLPGLGKIEIEAIAEIQPPSGARKALGIDIRTDTPSKNQLMKYREIRATWMEADRTTLLQRGYDLIAIQSFTTKRLGRFQVRDMAYVQIQREAGKGWPDMPALPPSAKSKRPLTAEGPQMDPAVLTAAISQAFQIAPGGLADPLATAVANLEVGEAAAVANLAPADPDVQARAFKVSTQPE
jgi:hypothetical protein